MKAVVQQQWFSISDACRYLGKSRTWIESQISSGKLPKRWLGGNITISREDLDALVVTEGEELKPRRFE